MLRIATVLFVALLNASSASPAPTGDLDRLAASGHIDESAPVKAESQIVIHAAPEKVWRLLTDIDNWPKWQANVSAAALHGALAPGTSFNWTSGGTKIESRLALVHPFKQIAWTGAAMKAHAAHVWTLQPLPDGSTLVKTSESMEGFLLTLFYSSNDVAKSHQVWLANLKQAAEKK